MDTRTALPVGTLLDGSYRIERQIGSGGFGITYVARDVNLETFVAIKEYFPGQFGHRDTSQNIRPISKGHEPTFNWGRDSFVQEARTLARFRHPSIVQVTRVFEANATAYMVMALEQGRSLEHWLKGLARLPTQRELDTIVAPLLDALALMHAESFLHRDIAPDNIIVRADGTPVLLDFGAARRAIAEQSKALTGIVKGGYSPQEQYATDGRLQGAWTDIYALGATLYRAVSGCAPDEATTRVIDDRVVPAAKIAAGPYRPSFLRGIDACLKVRPSERPQSIAELKPILLGQSEAASVGASSPAENRKTDGGRGKVAAASVAMLLLAGAVGGIVWHQQRAQVEFEALQARQEQERAASERAEQELAQKRKAEENKRKQAEAEEARRRADAEADRVGKEQERKRLADIIEKVRPAIVDVSATKKAAGTTQPELGNGFVISADGHVVTNSRLIEETSKVEVSFADQTKHTASLVGVDPRTQVALLKIDAGRSVPFLKFSDASPGIGDWAFPVASLAALDHATTAGRVSTLNRDAGMGPTDFIQVDAPFDGARVGGPTFDGDGDVMGVNTVVFASSGSSPGMAFVLPASIASAIVARLKESGAVERGWLGIKIQNVDADTASALGLSEASGALISEITPDGPAQGTDLRVQDAVLAIDGIKIRDSRDLARRIAEHPPGVTVDVEVWRNGSVVNVRLKLGKFPAAQAAIAQPNEDPIALVTARLGLTLSTTPRSGGGVEIVGVDPASDAYEKGIEKGDLILEVSGAAVTSAEGVADGIKRATLMGRKAIMLYLHNPKLRRIVPVALKAK